MIYLNIEAFFGYDALQKSMFYRLVRTRNPLDQTQVQHQRIVPLQGRPWPAPAWKEEYAYLAAIRLAPGSKPHMCHKAYPT